eukprot:CAMPEP_0119390244 /NCGR_PEP_ID=MMETSP1334-20130426/112549_1 /TAXON_ID=127549 /ORGANISM="Calcidiscus leptoporus, Strain RCC1130" /LENGTH=71 /DNA_ID=CAMNT_0007412687 /DNA_START=198 /DNA_END=409 /DNA_ORIENTATION=+
MDNARLLGGRINMGKAIFICAPVFLRRFERRSVETRARVFSYIKARPQRGARREGARREEARRDVRQVVSR